MVVDASSNNTQKLSDISLTNTNWRAYIEEGAIRLEFDFKETDFKYTVTYIDLETGSIIDGETEIATGRYSINGNNISFDFISATSNIDINTQPRSARLKENVLIYFDVAFTKHYDKIEDGKYVDLGLYSGTMWKIENEPGLYTYMETIGKYGDQVPTKEQLQELIDKCSWQWYDGNYKVIGPNGNYIILPAEGRKNCSGILDYVGAYGLYWSSTPLDLIEFEDAWGMYCGASEKGMDDYTMCYSCSVRLVINSFSQTTDLVNPFHKYSELRKITQDGQILILRGEKVYTVTGQEVK